MKVKVVKMGDESTNTPMLVKIDGKTKQYTLDGCWRCKGGKQEKNLTCIADVDADQGMEVEVDCVCPYEDIRTDSLMENDVMDYITANRKRQGEPLTFEELAKGIQVHKLEQEIFDRVLKQLVFDKKVTLWVALNTEVKS